MKETVTGWRAKKDIGVKCLGGGAAWCGLVELVEGSMSGLSDSRDGAASDAVPASLPLLGCHERSSATANEASFAVHSRSLVSV